MSTQIAPPATGEIHPVKPLTPAEVKESPKSREELTSTIKIINSHLSDGTFAVPIGDKLKPSTVREAIAEFAKSGWAVKKSTDKTSHEVMLHFKEKRDPKVGTARKKGTKKAPPAAPAPN